MRQSICAVKIFAGTHLKGSWILGLARSFLVQSGRFWSIWCI